MSGATQTIRTRPRRGRAAVVATLVLALSPLAAAEPAGAARPLVTGVSYVRGEDPLTFSRVRSAGAKFAHVWLNWASVAPAGEPDDWRPSDPADPSYRWDRYDRWVSNAVAAGLQPLLQIYGVPHWAQGCQSPRGLPESPCEVDRERFVAFATAAATRYSGSFGGLPRVRYWQGLNEPNLDLFFNPQFRNGKPFSPRLYRDLLNAFYDAVKSVNPSNLVLAAGLGPIARPGSTIGPMRFARELLCMRGRWNPVPTSGDCGGGVRFDIFDIHPYTTGGPTHQGQIDDVQLGDLAKLTTLLAAADQAGRIGGRFRRTPLWITELSWDSSPPDPGGVPLGVLTRWTAEALYRSWAAGVSHFFWYTLVDPAPTPQLPFSATFESGLYSRGDTTEEDRPKPNLQAFRFPFVAYPSKMGFTYWGRTPSSTGGRVLIQVRKAGGWRTVSRARADRHGIFEGEVEEGSRRGRRHNVRARYRVETAAPFSLKPVKDYYQPPFGKPVG